MAAMSFGPEVTSLTFTNNQLGAQLLEKLYSQRLQKQFCDVILHCNNQIYPAHRCVLASCSPYFFSVLRCDSDTKEQFSISCQSQCSFEDMLNYLYTGIVTITTATVGDLLLLANHFVITSLKNYCHEFLERSMTTANVINIKETADRCGLPDLSKTVAGFIQRHIDTVVKEESLLYCQATNITNLLSDTTIQINEVAKFHLIIQWTQYNIVEREKHLMMLLSFINWQKLEMNYLAYALKSERLFTDNEKCVYYLLETLQMCGLLQQQHADYLLQLRKMFTVMPPMTDLANCISDITESIKVTRWQDEESHNEEDNEVSHTRNVRKEAVKTNFLGRRKAKLPKKVITAPISSIRSRSSTTGMRTKGSLKMTHRRHIKKFKDVLNEKKSMQENLKQDKVVNKKGGDEWDYQDENDDSAPLDDEEDDDYEADTDYQPRLKSQSMYEDYDDPDTDIPVLPRTSNRFGRTTRATRITLRKKRNNLREVFKCPNCIYKTRSKTLLDTHQRKAHSEDQHFSCAVCDFETEWNREYWTHLKSHFPGPPYKCDSCSKEYDRVQMLMAHRLSHSDIRPWPCSTCAATFRTKGNLKAHLKTHSGVKPFQCQICFRCFATKCTMEQHQVTHSDTRPYLCDLCGFATKFQNHLIAHKRIHTGNVFRCEFPDCKYFSPRRAMLKAHQKIHQGIRAHVCQVCGKSFVEKSHLVRHERMHLSEKPFKCTYCEYGSTRKDKLKEHNIKHHGPGGTPKSAVKSQKRTQKVPVPDYQATQSSHPPTPTPQSDPPPPEPTLASMSNHLPPNLPGVSNMFMSPYMPLPNHDPHSGAPSPHLSQGHTTPVQVHPDQNVVLNMTNAIRDTMREAIPTQFSNTNTLNTSTMNAAQLLMNQYNQTMMNTPSHVAMGTNQTNGNPVQNPMLSQNAYPGQPTISQQSHHVPHDYSGLNVFMSLLNQQ